MELLVIFTLLCISLSLLQTPCASLQIQVPSSHEKSSEVKLSTSTLPRKLRFTTSAEVTVKTLEHEDHQDTMSHNKQKKEDVSAGKVYNKKEQVGKNGSNNKAATWQEWVEGTDTSQYFTMDYSHVKRRRPIHNKSLPVDVAP